MNGVSLCSPLNGMITTSCLFSGELVVMATNWPSCDTSVGINPAFALARSSGALSPSTALRYKVNAEL
jgi:hypothetical protein